MEHQNTCAQQTILTTMAVLMASAVCMERRSTLCMLEHIVHGTPEHVHTTNHSNNDGRAHGQRCVHRAPGRHRLLDCLAPGILMATIVSSARYQVERRLRLGVCLFLA